MNVREYENWIDGAWAKSDRKVERKSPAHGELLARFAQSDESAVNAAIEGARKAFDNRSVWSAIPGAERAKALGRWVDLLTGEIDRLALIEAEEVGKPIRFAKAEVEWSIELARYAAALAWQIPGDLVSNIGDANLGLVTREPRGVIGMITPWNFPLVTLFQKLPFALAAGCTVVIKPSELTSGSTLEIARLAKEAGIPDGVINVVTGSGRTVGEMLTGHRKVDMISFTGSTAVGIRIAQRAAEQVKRVGLELGGKAANIVFADADIDAALDGILLGYVLNQGEECVQGTRLLVEDRVADTFLDKLVERSKKIRLGLPTDEKADVGALIHEKHMEQVLSYIQSGIDEGATLLLGGSRVTENGLGRGFYVAPTIFSDVTPDMTIFREEIFGPVLAVTRFTSVDQAIALANDTNYGLGNGVWTKDIDKAIRVSRELRSGTVYVNTFLETAVQMPFGGFKESGIGRENGLDGLLEFTEVKSTFIKLGQRPHALPHTLAN
ncbi:MULTISPECIES: aldehyde dehydrogenase family protein [unclassified Mesorhizobium]|uniref:aldehyde dehydrogenase family protein n=1 Tax=unclassified Mesorhizobium TaxID=325217 RepID=UPI000FD9FC1B|nr:MULTISPECIES: aldehyde dehydrogenase family protein [unclassified Mesorhizobium]TGR43663.1 aldehyde dehydrogenase family protein [bacterium M00.F.Ca.ET.199.01.1.1]TGU40274.1 aldehyde dehydrogenase family protein [bacterium M00.F.Ca.ET.156.01.1.1]TGV54079.1 aldehyde dehydrogenase family protein [bacterium M00.F.Ca.ET.141.01.1.1]TGV86815.1 aldehyde dehydrogenase family protein [Mesorhizobium sp. M00.F.Ca.ET.149.01.1.1]TGR27995.1 aldehyde dehydrogenase family protein [Mesorhizobium sp. M8A.F.C